MLATMVVLCIGAPAGAGTFELAHTVVDPAHGRNDFFAAALAARGVDVLAGARFDDRAATDAGAAYLIDASGAVRLDLKSPTPAIGDQFGSAVASLGNDLLVGAPHVDEAGSSHAGAVYLFDGLTGARRRTFQNPNPDLAELFGYALGVVGGELLVGAPFYNAQVRGSGATYLFDPGSGELMRSFRNPNPEEYDLFGQALAAVGSNVVVGAPFDDSAASDAGAVYLLDPVQRIPLRTFISPNPHSGDFFGAAVAANGNLVLVGAPFDDTVASDSGAAYVFDATTGALVRSFVDPAANVDGRFGSAVAWRGQQALIGAPFADTETATDTGGAYLFDAATGDLIETFANPTPADGDQFGATVTVAGDAVVVGAWLDDTAAANAGALYIFRDTTPPTTTATTETTTTSVTTTATVTVTLTTDTTVTTETPTTSSSSTTSSVETTTTSVTTSTATDSLPSTTLTTSTAADTTTTTSEPAALSCEDGDECTTDAVTPMAECVHAALAVPEGSLCHLTVLATMLEAEPPETLGGRRRRARLLHRVAGARHLLEPASGRKPRRQRRARRSIAGLATAIRRSAHAGTIDPRLAARLLARAIRARAEL